MKKKAKFKYRWMWYPTIKSRKRDWGLIVYLGVLSYSRAQRLLICSETSKASILHVRGINLAFYWAFDAKKRQKLCTQSKQIRSIKYKNYYNARRKGILGLPIISTVTTLTSCFKKKKKSNTYFINNNYKAQQLDFPMNEPLHLKREREREREGSEKDTQRCK